ncbi:leishmanolysin-like peptidase [Gouania willdenowi]|uniref:leishmanolysin-like peptidase n=1 Tax=Gouania willdenowi TaxID=441366 RepID=UPI0010564322|nr:leishmanolysin-like peptidase [Gouania willdenowi]
MEPSLSADGKSSASWSLLGPALTLSVLAVVVSCHGVCKHQTPVPEEVVHHVYLKPERLTKRSSPEDLQLKIKIIYDRSVDELTADKRRLVKDKLFPQAIDYLQRAFSVRRRVGAVLLSRQCATNQYMRKRDDPHRYCQEACADVTRCGPVIVPQHHLQVDN